MSGGAKLSVTVGKATGHGPHGLFPSEGAYLIVEVPGATPPKVETGHAVKEKAALLWMEELQFELGPDSKEVKLALHGQLRENLDDCIGAGTCNLTTVFGSPRDRSPQDLRVLLEAPNGKQTGEVELSLAYST